MPLNQPKLKNVFSAAEFIAWAQTTEGREYIRKWSADPITQAVLTAFIDSTRHRPANESKWNGVPAETEAVNGAFSDGQQDILFALLQITRLTDGNQQKSTSQAEQGMREYLINVEGYKDPTTVTKPKR
jgi:hypothetical protein